MAVAARKVINRRVRYETELAAQKKEGHPFFPYAMFHDTVVNLIIVLMIVAMAVVWHATAGPVDAHHPDGQNGLLGALYEGKANPAVAGHRAAAGVVLPVPVRAPADLQVAVGADLRDDHHPDDPDGAAGRVAVPRPRPRPADLAPARRHGARPDACRPC